MGPGGIVRRLLGMSIILTLAGTVGAIFALLFVKDMSPTDTKDLAVTVLTAVVSVTGTVLGFYFGASTTNQSR